MCSINGFNHKDEQLARKMVEATRHRGPDDEGFYCDENFSLGHARLSIIDLSERARQPIWNEDGSLCIIFNGEIYNFKELRKDLEAKGHNFRSSSDTEVILHLYEEKGRGCLSDLNGIFAFAIYNKKNGEVFLARDRIGVKPLYYYFDGQKFIFSSEIKAILKHPIPREINEEALAHYFRIFFVPAPFTLINNIKKLPPAHCLLFKAGKIKMEQYWDLEDREEIKNPKEAVASIKSLLKDSVARQLVADRPVGVFLSGGIDSSSILGIASELKSGPIKTYSVGFDIDIEKEKYNRDFELARQTSDYYKTDHHELLVSDEMVRDSIVDAIVHMEEPIPNPIQIPTFLLAKMAKEDVAVVLGGDGGDELFGGYPRYYYSKLIDRYQMIPGFIRRGILPGILEKFTGKKGLDDKLNTPPGVARYLLHMGQKHKILSEVLKGGIDKDITYKFLKDRYPENKFQDKAKYFMYLDLLTWLPDESLIRSDKMTMAWGLEERVPILDHRLVELAFRIPTKYKVRGKKNNKWIFREAMKDYLPPHLLNKEKVGWFSPASKWLRAGLKDFAYEVLSPDYCPGTEKYFDFSKIKTILENHISQKEYNLDIIWSLITFQIWYKNFIE